MGPKITTLDVYNQAFSKFQDREREREREREGERERERDIFLVVERSTLVRSETIEECSLTD